MKKLGSLISGILTVAFLTGCGSQTATTFAPIQNSNDTGVSIQSAQGLKSFYTVLTEKAFTAMDTNKDKQISFDEFKARQLNITPGFASAPASVPEPVTTQIESVNPPADVSAPGTPATAAPTAPSAPLDPLQIFLKIDKNKNGRITLAEAKASKLFLGVSQTDLRKMFVPLFNSFDADKNKSVSNDEFVKAISSLDYATKQGMLSLFFSSDKNFDNKLNFSEFEDLVYASFKATWELPANTPVPAPVPNQPTPPTQAPASPDPGTPASSTPGQPASSAPVVVPNP